MKEIQEESESRLRIALDSGRMGTWIWELATNSVSWDRRQCELFGANSPQEAVSFEQFFNMILPADRERVRCALATLLEAGSGCWDEQFRIMLPDGRIRWLAGRGELKCDANGRPLRVIGVDFDITQRKQAEEALRESEAKLRAVVEAIPAFLLVLEEDGRIVESLTHESSSLFFNEPPLKQGRTIAKILPKEPARRMIKAIHQALLVQQSQNIEYEMAVAGRSECHFEAYIAPLGIPITGKPMVAVLIHDITQRHRAEEDFRQIQKMDAVGQLTGGVAHDFNNILAIILGNLELLAYKLDEKTDLQSLIQQSIQAVERGASLIQRLLTFSRRRSLQIKPVDLNTLIRETIEMLHHTLGERIQIDTQLSEDPAETVIDPAQFETALLNLAVNARDAMPQGGILTIATAVISCERGDSLVRRHVKSDSYVKLTVTDNGIGMTPEVLERACEPFFTTKEKGSGFGLSMVYGLVKQCGGYMRLDSEVNRGTTVIIYLPYVQVKSVATEDTEIQPMSPATNQIKTVLVVEDDAEVRQVIIQMLQNLGYQTLDAADTDTALQLLEESPPVSLLFIDVVVPGKIDGINLVLEARKRRPDLKILFTSGYSDRIPIEFSRISKDIEFLYKPFSRSQLRDKLQLLD